jgi:hypothetical protein
MLSKVCMSNKSDHDNDVVLRRTWTRTEADVGDRDRRSDDRDRRLDDGDRRLDDGDRRWDDGDRRSEVGMTWFPMLSAKPSKPRA